MGKVQGTRFTLVVMEPVTRIMCFHFTCLDDASVNSLTKQLAKRFFAYEGNAERIISLMLSITVGYRS